MKNDRRTKGKNVLHGEWLCLSFIPKKKDRLQKYTEVIQLINIWDDGDTDLDDVSELFQLLWRFDC